MALIFSKKKDPHTIEIAIHYLEADPFFYRLGYIKETLIHLLKQANFSHQQILKLQGVLLAAIQHEGRREFTEYCRFAKKIQTADFEKQLQNIICQEINSKIVKRAQKMLATMKS